MPLIADCLTDVQSAELAALPTKREVTAKRGALIERDGHLDFNGERCSPCVDCGHVYIASGLRLTRGANARMLCRSCFAQTKIDRFQNDSDREQQHEE